MNSLTKLKIYGEAYFANKAELPLSELVDAKSRTLGTKAPSGNAPFYLTVQPDGSTLTAEIARPDDGETDELALRDHMGDIYANSLQHRATRIVENISRFDMDTRDTLEALRDTRERLNDLMEHTYDYYFAGKEARRNLVWLVILSLGEISAMLNLFADFFGLDSLKLSQEAIKHPFLVLSTATFTIGFYVASLLIAEHALKGNRRVLWLIVLASLAFLTAHFRAAQTAATGESDTGALFLMLMYTAIGFTFPLAAAVFFIRWQETGHLVGRTDSMMTRLREQEALYTERLRQIEAERQSANDELANATKEYVEHYQHASGQREKSRADWENHRRRMEAYLADTRLAYDFWTGWRRRGANIPKPIRRLIQIAGALLLAFSIVFAMSHIAHAETRSNILVVCDRSTSASDYSCTPEAIESLGRLWIKKADEAGGGTFELFLIDQGFDTTDLLFSAEYPDRFPGPVSAHKKRWKNEFLRELAAKLKELPSKTGSAIIEAVYRCSLRMPDAGGTVIYVLSDMREVNGVFNFEKRVPSVNEFSLWLKREAIELQLKEQDSIVVCGIHPYTPDNTSRMTTQNYNQLLRLWKEVFEHWGVKASFREACDFNIMKEE